MIYLKKSSNSWMTIQDMTLEERPREKMILNGPDSLSDAELLAIIIRSGTQKLNAIQLGQAIIKKADNIRYLQDLTIEELKSINGIGETALKAMPKIMQLFIRKPKEVSSGMDFERRLYVLRRSFENDPDMR